VDRIFGVEAGEEGAFRPDESEEDVGGDDYGIGKVEEDGHGGIVEGLVFVLRMLVFFVRIVNILVLLRIFLVFATLVSCRLESVMCPDVGNVHGNHSDEGHDS